MLSAANMKNAPKNRLTALCAEYARRVALPEYLIRRWQCLRRLNGKYLAPKSQHLEDRVKEIKDGTFTELIEALMGKPIEELKELYNNRDIEK